MDTAGVMATISDYSAVKPHHFARILRGSHHTFMILLYLVMWNVSQEGHWLHSLFLSVLSASCRYKCGMHELFLLDTILGFMWRVHLPGMLSTASTRHRCVEVELSAARALRCISPSKEGRMSSHFWVPLRLFHTQKDHIILILCDTYTSYHHIHNTYFNLEHYWDMLRWYNAWFHITRITSVPVFSSFLV